MDEVCFGGYETAAFTGGTKHKLMDRMLVAEKEIKDGAREDAFCHLEKCASQIRFKRQWTFCGIADCCLQARFSAEEVLELGEDVGGAGIGEVFAVDATEGQLHLGALLEGEQLDIAAPGGER